MKVRQGFVSNSSTTSFFIAVCDKADERDELFLEFVDNFLSGFDEVTNSPKTMKAEVKEYVSQIESQLAELNADIVFAKNEYDKFKEILSDEKLLNVMMAYGEARSHTDITSRRFRRENEYLCSPKYIFESEMEMFTRAVESREKKIKELTSELKKIEGIRNRKDIKYLMRFEMDANRGSSKMYNQIELMEKTGLIEIIDRSTT